jgi:hypothetical protein
VVRVPLDRSTRLAKQCSVCVPPSQVYELLPARVALCKQMGELVRVVCRPGRGFGLQLLWTASGFASFAAFDETAWLCWVAGLLRRLFAL